MERISGAGAIGGMFVSEDLAASRPPTEVTEKWLNDVQEEIVAVSTAAGANLDGTKRDQMITAIRALIAAGAQADKTLRLDVSAGGTITLSPMQNANTIFELFGTPTTPVILVFANAAKHLVVDIGSVAQPVTVSAQGGSGVMLPIGSGTSSLYCNGLGAIELAAVSMATFLTNLSHAGKNADGLRTNILLPAGTDPNTVTLENGDYNFDASTSPNMPTSGLVWVQMSVTRHHNTSWIGMPAGKYIFATIVLRDFYTNRAWERRAVTDLSGVTTFTPWSSPQAISFAPVAISRTFNAVYTNSRSSQIFVSYNFGLLTGQGVTVLVDGINVDTVNPNTPAGSFGGFMTVRPGGNYEFVTSTGAIMQSCVEYA